MNDNANEARRDAMISIQEPPLVVTRQFFANSKEEVERLEHAQTTNCTLLRHLWTFRNRECTKPRDRVFAMKALSLDVGNLIEPDCEDDVGQTSAKAALTIVEHHKKLDILGMCITLEGCEPGGGERPSWAPDLGLPARRRPFTSLTMFLGEHEPYYTATMSSEATLGPCNLKRLTTYGHRVGIVAALGSEKQKTWDDMVRHSKELVDQLPNMELASNTTRMEAFWRTLITNRNSNSEPASVDTEGEQFKLWWATLTKQATYPLLMYLNFNSAFLQHFNLRSFFTTSTGHIGLGPEGTKVDDHVVLLSGTQVPFILRQKDEHYQVIGEAYVHGIMDGSYWNNMTNQEMTSFSLV